MDTLWSILLFVLLPVSLAEFTELAPWLSKKVSLFAARRLRTAEQVERYSEEWLADIEHCPGKLTKLLVACGFVIASWRLRSFTQRIDVGARRRSLIPPPWLPPALTGAFFVGLWYLASDILLDPSHRRLLPTPDRVIRVAFIDSRNRSDILSALWLSTWIAGLGFAIAVVLGLAMGVAMARARWLERSFYPYAIMLQCVPMISMVPLIAFWFGFGLTSRLIVVTLASVFPVVASTLFGLQSVDRNQHELFTLHRATWFARLLKLQMPAALPAILTGVQVSAVFAVTSSVVGDFFFKQGDAGIGVLMDLYRARNESEQMMGAAVVTVLLGVATYLLIGLCNRFVTRRLEHYQSSAR